MCPKRVLAAGKFDILHPGHLSYLRQARELAGPDGELVVVIALDKTIERERGAPPVFPQEQRRQLVEALDVVDRAVLGYDTEDRTQIVRDLKPDIVALGYDQVADIEALQRLFDEGGLPSRVVRLSRLPTNDLCSSTEIRRRIVEYYHANGTV